MNPASSHLMAQEFIHALRNQPRRWLLPTLVLGLLGILYAAFGPASWESSQALIIRNEAANSNAQGPGKFSHTDEMKTVQETILELARGRNVLEGALRTVDAPADQAIAPAAVDTLRDAVKLSPPKGAEFGKTEIFYLKVRDRDPDRAKALNTAVCQQLQARFQEIRDAKAQSMIDELAKTVQLARADLEQSTGRLVEIETRVGSDLSELRRLHESGSGESALQRTYTEVCAELRQAESSGQAHQELLSLLKAAQANPARLLATPSRLLDSQPALRRLKEGLVDAQIRTAQHLGKMGEGHPLVKAAKESEQEIAEQLKAELTMAVRGLEVESRLNVEHTAMLEGRLSKINRRLQQLAEVRAVYANVVSEVKHREQLVQRAEQNLAEARAAQASARAISLITPVDVVAVKQAGVNRWLIALASVAGGLLVGLGLVVLSLPPVVTEPQTPPQTTIPRTIPMPQHGLSLRDALRKVVNGKTP